MRPRSVGFGGRFVGRGFVAKGVTFLDFTLKRPLVVHIDEPRPRLMSSTSPFRTDAPRSGLGCEFCGRFTLQYGILQHMAVTASCWALIELFALRFQMATRPQVRGALQNLPHVCVSSRCVVASILFTLRHVRQSLSVSRLLIAVDSRLHYTVDTDGT
jgi:hypothetical protein